MVWTDISAGETGGSARGKINQLGQEFDEAVKAQQQMLYNSYHYAR